MPWAVSRKNTAKACSETRAVSHRADGHEQPERDLGKAEGRGQHGHEDDGQARAQQVAGDVRRAQQPGRDADL
jgi:hypothetical protein